MENKTREVPIFSRDHPQILHPQGNGRTRPPPRCEMPSTHMSQLSRWLGGSPGLQGRSRSATSEGYRESDPKKSRGRGRNPTNQGLPPAGMNQMPQPESGSCSVLLLWLRADRPEFQSSLHRVLPPMEPLFCHLKTEDRESQLLTRLLGKVRGAGGQKLPRCQAYAFPTVTVTNGHMFSMAENNTQGSVHAGIFRAGGI